MSITSGNDYNLNSFGTKKRENEIVVLTGKSHREVQPFDLL